MLEMLNSIWIVNYVGNMNSIKVINNIGKLDYVKLEKVVWIVGK